MKIRNIILPAFLGSILAVVIANFASRTPKTMEIFQATKIGDVAEIKRLLHTGVDVNARGTDVGWTPLHLAASWGHADVVELLLAEGADVDPKDQTGWTPLHVAAIAGHADVAALLLDNGADVESVDRNGDTPLLIAVKRNHPGVVRVLLAKGANVNARDEMGKTPLFDAAFYGREDLVRILLASGADVNIEDEDGMTALIWSHNNVTDLLKQHGAKK